MSHYLFTPGALVRHPAQPDWGISQVQSVDGKRVTVNFQQAGKRVINTDHINLERVAIDGHRED